jgi:hypothetical protein
MAELIGALVEALAAIVMAIVEAIPVIIEMLVYLAAGAITIIGYALSRRFRERKRREWTERPKRKYVDLGISAACLTVLVIVGLWIFLPRSKPTPSRDSLAGDDAGRQSGEFRVVIRGRSAQTSNQLTIELKKGALAKLLHRKSHHDSGQTVTNELQPNGPANGSQPSRSDTNATPSAPASYR